MNVLTYILIHAQLIRVDDSVSGGPLFESPKTGSEKK